MLFSTSTLSLILSLVSFGSAAPIRQTRETPVRRADLWDFGRSKSIPLRRSWNAGLGDHFYTTDAGEQDRAVPGRWVKENDMGQVLPSSWNGAIPIFRSWSGSDHFYTTNKQEHENAVRSLGYGDEGITGYCFAKKVTDGMVLLRRAWHAGNTDHFYTVDENEHHNAVRNLGYADEGNICWVFEGKPADAGRSVSVPLLRSWNEGIADHFYTTDANEQARAVPSWKIEGPQGRVLTSLVTGAIPVFRSWSGSDHFYTQDSDEHRRAVSSLGYSDEGIAWYCWPTQEPGTTMLFRFWKESTTDHFYTIDATEKETAIKTHGYVQEKDVCWVLTA